MGAISLYGAGHLTESLLEGLAQATPIPISIFNRSAQKLDLLAANYPYLIRRAEPKALVQEKTFVLLIIPAAAILDLDSEFIQRIEQTGSVMVSCANGLSLEKLSERYPGLKILRALPNIHWRIRQGITLLRGNNRVSPSEIEEFSQFLSPVSGVYVLDQEESFDRLGKLTSCGPGLYPEIFRQLCLAFGIEDGQERATFYRVMKATADYLIQTRKAPEEVIAEVANKGGLTEAGVATLMERLPSVFSEMRKRMDQRAEERRRALARIQ